MLVACINCYNDWPLIKECVESIYDQVDRIIAVDGRFINYPKGNWYSTDGTIEYLTSLEKVELIFAAGLLETEKRNVYMDMLKPGDTVLVIDGDETVKGKIRKLDKRTDIGLIGLGDPGRRTLQGLQQDFLDTARG